MKCKCGCGRDVTWNKGKKQWNTIIHGHNNRIASEETRKKLADARRGKPSHNRGKKVIFSKEHRTKLAKAQTGKAYSLKSRKKMSESQKKCQRRGSHISIMKCRSGEKGYCDQWYDGEYKEDLRKDVCDYCGITEKESISKWGKRLGLHHKDDDKENCHPDNIATSCCSCHTKEHWKLGTYLKKGKGSG